MMNLHIPKVTIYRIGKLDPNNPLLIDLMLLIRNPNDSKAEVSFAPLTKEQIDDQADKIIVQTEMPRQAIRVDTQEIYQDTASTIAPSMANSAATDVKA